jgi:5-methylcytosine-specific restriction endonuclease McrA
VEAVVDLPRAEQRSEGAVSSTDQETPARSESRRADSRLAQLEQLQSALAERFGDARLTIELVPKTSWYSNVRSNVSSAEWDRLRRPVYQRARSRCEICGGRGTKHPVECHEVWLYDDAAGFQRLVDLIALCPPCHSVKHLGRSHLKGRGDDAIVQLMRVNGWTAARAEAYVDLVLDIWKLRSVVSWRLDLAWLAERGVSAPAGPGPLKGDE